jgi:hypothetical protein
MLHQFTVHIEKQIGISDELTDLVYNIPWGTDFVTEPLVRSCNRKVLLDFDMDSQQDRETCVKAAILILESCTGFPCREVPHNWGAEVSDVS